MHARSRAPAWSALLAARRAGVPFVTTYHGAYGETNALKRLYNSVMARGDVVIANSRYTADLIAQRYGTPRATHGRDPSRRRLSPCSIPAAIAPSGSPRLRARWGVDAGERVILHAARLTAWKGQSVLIDAAARLKAAGQLGDAVVVLAGDAQGRDAYAAGAAQPRSHRPGLQAPRPPRRPCRGHGRGLSCRARDGRRLDRARGVRPGRHRGGGHGLAR